jgi:hypothetical protein
MVKQYKNPGIISFSAKINRNQDVSNSSAWVEFPFDLNELFGVGNLIPIKAIFDGKVRYQGSLAKMGGRHPMLILRKDIRDQLGKQPGDVVDVRVELDDVPRELIVPEDLRKALTNANQLQMFDKLAFSHRKEYILNGLKRLRSAKQEQNGF